MDGASTAELLFRQRLPLTASTKHVDDALEHLASRQRLSASTRPALVFPVSCPRPRRNQRFHASPKLVRYLPACQTSPQFQHSSTEASWSVNPGNLASYLWIGSKSIKEIGRAPNGNCHPAGAGPQIRYKAAARYLIPEKMLPNFHNCRRPRTRLFFRYMFRFGTAVPGDKVSRMRIKRILHY